ncbi:cytochrome-c peroxidase [Azoarcus sp. L1K30]|uniref:cytochrome-c peroxidase n=1 Tax=Azoarcus sp. L1K30 TaxID=2820277 RepID=UPI001B811309|nr:cytochrome-c peroxidase [Azoarcus sp. L1K30]MBR0565178.1 cytochrome-c peroxidase [Azoarcus sp. L1K30]
MADAIRREEPLAPLPTHQRESDPDRVALGEQLFRDPLLSSDYSISCASCHPLDRAGADNLPRSKGVGGATGTINAPTVFNASLNFVQFWDGRATTLKEQVRGPVHNPVEMNSNWDEIVARLQRREDYRARFARAYPQGISGETIADAIARFEETLLTPNAPFDRYLRGEAGALNPEQIEGYNRFKNLGCASCHQGANIGGNLFQRFGVMGDYFASRGTSTPSDLGRFNVTGRMEDRHVFKVPSLRNVALTAPYFHDGSVTQLDEAVEIMARYQLGRELSAEDKRLLVAFLSTLTGEYRGEPLK